jgi:hypothetical protein
MSDGRKPGQALVRNGPERTEGLSNTFADTASMLRRDEEEVRQGGPFVGDKPRIISEGEHNSRVLLHRGHATLFCLFGMSDTTIPCDRATSLSDNAGWIG